MPAIATCSGDALEKKRLRDLAKVYTRQIEEKQKQSERLLLNVPPKAVVKLLDEIFTAFDDLADRHGIEKIKTIGDAYMAVAACRCRAPTTRKRRPGWPSTCMRR